MTSVPGIRQVPDEEVKWHCEFLGSWLRRLGHDVSALSMPRILVLAMQSDAFERFVLKSDEMLPGMFQRGQLEEYGFVVPTAEAVPRLAGVCFRNVRPCTPKEAEYVIIMREGYTAPHLGAEVLHVFEGQLGIRAGTLEQQFKQMYRHYEIPSRRLGGWESRRGGE